MWRLLLVVGVVSLGLAACGDDEVDVEEFYRRLSALGDGTFTVTYEMETISKSETEIRDLVWYRDASAESDSPLGSLTGRLDQSGEFGFLSDISGPTSYRCGEFEGERFCPVASCCVTSPPQHWFVFPALDRNRATVVDSRGETIAGAEAECYDVETDSSVPYTTYEVCLSEDGLLLAGTTVPFDSGNPETKGTVISMTAVEATLSVPDDAFEPPYEVTDRRTDD
jgi:hypothetical protein